MIINYMILYVVLFIAFKIEKIQKPKVSALILTIIIQIIDKLL